ncbi:hypothetical protein DPF_1366 [Desulfoplanes formicivorans]|uniref:Uncharacterized protein n=1 Tax=Desulfoplanes formicivorans TaxID=1592317 RepID=A0A194AHG3_9BACT|nr:hypothetical protein DPF_1366 [Desulfoplanes formicivorans]
MQAKKFAHNPFDAIALHSIAHFFAHGKTEPPGILVLPVADKEDEMGRKIPTAQIVTRFKLGPSEKMMRFGKC